MGCRASKGAVVADRSAGGAPEKTLLVSCGAATQEGGAASAAGLEEKALGELVKSNEAKNPERSALEEQLQDAPGRGAMTNDMPDDNLTASWDAFGAEEKLTIVDSAPMQPSRAIELNKSHPLWPQGAVPGAKGDNAEDQPTITVYPADARLWNPASMCEGHLASDRARWLEGTKGLSNDAAKKQVMREFPDMFERVPASGCGVVLFPGGEYNALATDREGVQPAKWLSQRGITAFVVKYRVGERYQQPAMMHDARRAIRWVRHHSASLGIDTRRLGVWGFSAGGHLAATVATRFSLPGPLGDVIDAESSRPDFCILAYPLITMTDEYTHNLSRKMLVGSDHPSRELVEEMSNEKHVTKNMPPVFLFHCRPDRVVSVKNSIMFSKACQDHGVPCETHLYDSGDHNIGLAQDLGVLREWIEKLDSWLKRRWYKDPDFFGAKFSASPEESSSAVEEQDAATLLASELAILCCGPSSADAAAQIAIDDARGFVA